MAGRASAQTGTATKTKPPSSSHAADNYIVVRLAKACSIEDVDRGLTQLVAPKPANCNTVCNFEWLLNLAIDARLDGLQQPRCLTLLSV